MKTELPDTWGLIEDVPSSDIWELPAIIRSEPTGTCKKHGEMPSDDLRVLKKPVCLKCFLEFLEKNNMILDE